LKERLVDHLALIEAHIDFPEEEIEPISLREMTGNLRGTVEKL
jgi:tRNA U34 5-carboxymethylaminomethyl modifying GTPase MnmE/TrmE